MTPSVLALSLILASAPPAATVPAVPGWLALATTAPVAPDAPQVQRRYGFLPEHAAAEIVITTEGWEDVKSGLVLSALTGSGVTTATFTGAGSEKYGCDGVATAMARFDAPARPPENAVWLLPREDASGATVIVPQEVPRQDEARQWSIGPFDLVLKKSGRMTGYFILRRGTEALLTEPFEKHLMEGAEDAPLDLKGDREVGVPSPMLAFQRGTLLWLVLVTQAYEGVGFQVAVVRDGKAAVESAGYLYSCAF